VDKDRGIERESGGNKNESVGVRDRKMYREWEQMKGQTEMNENE